MSKKNKNIQAPAVEEAQEGVVEKKEMTTEEKNERIHHLLLKLQEAKDTKETGAQKKIRRNLRKLGFFISKEKEKMMEVLLESTVTE